MSRATPSTLNNTSSTNPPSAFISKLSKISDLDIIGKEPALKIDGEKRNKTVSGGLLCLTIYLLMIIAFLYFGQEIIYKKIPTTVKSTALVSGVDMTMTENLDESNNNNGENDNNSNNNNNDYINNSETPSQLITTGIPLGENGFSIFLAVHDKFGKLIESEGIFELKANFITTTRKTFPIEDEITNEEISNEDQQVGIRKCENDTFKYYGKEVKHLKPENWMCINTNTNTNNKSKGKSPLRIKGNIQTNLFSRLELTVEKCVNKTLLITSNNNNNNNNSSSSENNNAATATYTGSCKPINQITNKLNQAKLVIKFSETIFDYIKYSDFATQILTDENIYFTQNSLKKSSFEIIKIKTRTDIGYLLEDFDDITYYQKHQSNINTLDLSSPNSPLLAHITFHQSLVETSFVRKYYKLQNLFAELGGLAKSFLILAVILNYFHDEAKYFSRLIDGLFDMDDLYRYYQFYNSNNKKIFRKYRDSIILKNTKMFDDVKISLNIHNNHPVNYNNTVTNNAGGNYHSNINNYFNTGMDPMRSKNKLMEERNVSSGSSSKPNSKNINSNVNNSKNIQINRNDNNSNNMKFEAKELEEDNLNNNNNNNMNSNNLYASNKNDNYDMNDNVFTNNKMLNNKDSEREISSSDSDTVNEHDEYIEKIKKSAEVKKKFFSIKKKKFVISPFELLKYTCCPKRYDTMIRRHIIDGGKEMINNKTNLIYMLKKNLELDRFKNLLLKDHQLLLLNSLSKFMLDPEQVNLVDFESCTYERLIDAYGTAYQSMTLMDRNLAKWVSTKFQIE